VPPRSSLRGPPPTSTPDRERRDPPSGRPRRCPAGGHRPERRARRLRRRLGLAAADPLQPRDPPPLPRGCRRRGARDRARWPHRRAGAGAGVAHRHRRRLRLGPRSSSGPNGSCAGAGASSGDGRPGPRRLRGGPGPRWRSARRPSWAASCGATSRGRGRPVCSRTASTTGCASCPESISAPLWRTASLSLRCTSNRDV